MGGGWKKEGVRGKRGWGVKRRGQGGEERVKGRRRGWRGWDKRVKRVEKRVKVAGNRVGRDVSKSKENTF